MAAISYASCGNVGLSEIAAKVELLVGLISKATHEMTDCYG